MAQPLDITPTRGDESDESVSGSTMKKAESAPDPEDPRKPESPTHLPSTAWKHTFRRTVAEFTRDQCTDLAAGLTYYAVLSLFPALLAIVSLLGVFGQGRSTVDGVLGFLRDARFFDGDTLQALQGPIYQMVDTRAAGLTMVAGLLGAVWSASGYVGAFGRAMNRVYEVAEGRPVWKLRPQQLALTVATLVGCALIGVGMVVSGPIAESIGNIIGLGAQSLLVWNIAKWPVMLAVAALLIAVLYYYSPNVQQPHFRWISIGAMFALVVWIAASAGFAFYVSQFGNYNKTYGSLAGVVVFLLWLWITNVSLLFGAELDAELERTRQLVGGIKAEQSIQLPPRDTRGTRKAAEKRDEIEYEARRLRETAGAAGQEGDKQR